MKAYRIRWISPLGVGLIVATAALIYGLTVVILIVL